MSFYRISTLATSEIQSAALHAETGHRDSAVLYARRAWGRLRLLLEQDRTDASAAGQVALASMWMDGVAPWLSREQVGEMEQVCRVAAARFPESPPELRQRFELSQVLAGRARALGLLGRGGQSASELDRAIRLARDRVASPGAKLIHRMWLAELLRRVGMADEARRTLAMDASRFPAHARLQVLARGK
jgi:hypothetical protein